MHLRLSAYAAYGLISCLLPISLALSAPALPGDYPDPSIIRVGSDYWSTATSSAWAPEFPLLHSRDLVHWEIAGAVFARRPAWASGDFWAPEISEYQGSFAVYYSARRQGGPMCVAVATAPHPAGPYTDRGPLICQSVGSIDAAPVNDENGVRYLIWKQDGNSVKQPTPILAQPLSGDGTRLVGAPHELIRNDVPWEGPLVEGPYILRRNGWFYLFYSGAGCCTLSCDYALGVARSRKLLGPWQKFPGNPILKGNAGWKCPGHGSIVGDERGQNFLMYHAMSAPGSVYVGRQPIVDAVAWGADEWPSINGGQGPSGAPASMFRPAEIQAVTSFFDDFAAPAMRPGWQWPQDNEPLARLERGTGFSRLALQPNPGHAADPLGAVFARSMMTPNFVAQAGIALASLPPGVQAGLAAYGNAQQALGLRVDARHVTLWRRQAGKEVVIASRPLPTAARVVLRMTAMGGKLYRFELSADGLAWTPVGPPQDGSYLPPWDLGVRIALTAGGTSGTADGAARFDWLRIEAGR